MPWMPVNYCRAQGLRELPPHIREHGIFEGECTLYAVEQYDEDYYEREHFLFVFSVNGQCLKINTKELFYFETYLWPHVKIAALRLREFMEVWEIHTLRNLHLAVGKKIALYAWANARGLINVASLEEGHYMRPERFSQSKTKK